MRLKTETRNFGSRPTPVSAHLNLEFPFEEYMLNGFEDTRNEMREAENDDAKNGIRVSAGSERRRTWRARLWSAAVRARRGSLAAQCSVRRSERVRCCSRAQRGSQPQRPARSFSRDPSRASSVPRAPAAAAPVRSEGLRAAVCSMQCTVDSGQCYSDNRQAMNETRPNKQTRHSN